MAIRLCTDLSPITSGVVIETERVRNMGFDAGAREVPHTLGYEALIDLYDSTPAISQLENCDEEFTVQEVVEASKRVLDKPFSSSHVNQILATLAAQGLVYKNRHGRYSFAVPLLGRFIRRQAQAA